MRSTLPLLAALVCGAIAAPVAAADNTTTPAGPTLTVLGNGVANLAPDQASLQIDVRSGAFSESSARSKANARTNSIIAAITTLGVDRAKIQTAGITLERTSKPPLKGHKLGRTFYTASNSLSLGQLPVDLVGKIIDAATSRGADSIDGPDFSFADPSAGVGQAEAAAVSDARKRADASAAAAGYKVTGVQSINLDPSSGVEPVGSADAAAPSTGGGTVKKVATPTQIAPGVEEIDAQVQVVFAIAPA